MQKRWIIPGLVAAAFLFAATGLAKNPGHGNGHQKKFGPYGVVTDDHGSCGNAWASDTELRTFTVKRNKDGTFRLTRRDHGAFLTNDGQSPGACETHGRHGSTVPAGKNATFSCFTDSADCKFNYQYHAPRQHLRYHHWYDKGKGAGSMLHEKFRGDIAAS
jgi:hypothetical protein